MSESKKFRLPLRHPCANCPELKMRMHIDANAARHTAAEAVSIVESLHGILGRIATSKNPDPELPTTEELGDMSKRMEAIDAEEKHWTRLADLSEGGLGQISSECTGVTIKLDGDLDTGSGELEIHTVRVPVCNTSPAVWEQYDAMMLEARRTPPEYPES